MEIFASFCSVGTSKFGNDLAQPTPSGVTRPATKTVRRTQPQAAPGTFRGCSDMRPDASYGGLGGQEQVVELLNFAPRGHTHL